MGPCTFTDTQRNIWGAKGLWSKRTLFLPGELTFLQRECVCALYLSNRRQREVRTAGSKRLLLSWGGSEVIKVMMPSAPIPPLSDPIPGLDGSAMQTRFFASYGRFTHTVFFIGLTKTGSLEDWRGDFLYESTSCL